MSSQHEDWYFVRDGKVYYHYENDGYQAMKEDWRLQILCWALSKMSKVY